MSSPTRPEPEFETSEATGPERERRRDPRATVPWPATLQDANGDVARGEVIDVSLAGMKLRLGSPVDVGTEVTIRVTLPRGAGDIEVSAQIIRRDSEGVAVAFGGLASAAAARLKPLVPSWDLRRRAERIAVELPIQIDGHALATRGYTVDLSVVGGRVTTERPLTPGSLVVAGLTPRDGSGPMSIRAVVWEVDTRGAVLVFANLSTTDFARLRSYVDSLRARRS